MDHSIFGASVPPGLSKGSLADHKLAYYKAQTGKTGSLQDLERAFWVAKLNA